MTAQSVREDIEQSVGFSLNKRSRKRELVEARSVYYKVCRDKLFMGYQEIADSLEKNHATVLHSVKNVFPQLKHWNYNYYQLYLDLTDSTDELLETKKRLNSLDLEQLKQVNKLINEITN